MSRPRIRPCPKLLSVARVAIAGLLAALSNPKVTAAPALPRLQVSADGRHLVDDTGRPFFWLGDTAWELFHRLNRAESRHYLEDRARKRFTVIQAVALSELDGLDVPNAQGHRPLVDRDPARPDVRPGPDNDYWDHVDHVVRAANDLGLRVALLPTWGSHWHKDGGRRPAIFNPINARTYGEWLGRRYRHSGIVWVLGGDRRIGDDEERRTIEAMALGLRKGDRGRHLISFHPIGQHGSAADFHDAPWLDFNMVQTGHTRDRDNHVSVLADFCRTPVKPVLDAEPGYENIPHGFNPANGRLEAIHARRSCYWALLSGAFGHTYGCNEVWQMHAPGRKPVVDARLAWQEALQLPGASQMQHARALIESGPFFDRIPDPSLVVPPNASGPQYVAACRTRDGTGALAYLPDGQPVTLRTFLLKGPVLAAEWWDPRTGSRHGAGSFNVEAWKTTSFTPPTTHEDWILVLGSRDR